MKVRSALAGNYAGVEALCLEINKLHVRLEPGLIKSVQIYLTNHQFLEILEDPKQAILVLEQDEKMVGMAWLAERRHEGGQAIGMPVAFIYEIGITEGSRGKGPGRYLMNEIEHWAKERDAEELKFNVWSQNKQALAFYEALGFRVTRHEMSKTIV